jgi:NDP-sugar pyrophosphorylase family protein
MLDIDGVPVIERLVERMVAGGCGSIRVVTRPEKEDIRQYASARGLDLVLGYPAHLGESVAAGIGSANDETVALGFPDSLWEPMEGFALLTERLDGGFEVVLGLFDFPDAARADVVLVDTDGRVSDILVKPTDPPSTVIWGCLVARAEALRSIEHSAWPSEHLRPLIAVGAVGARYLSDRYTDIGTVDGLAHALEAARGRNEPPTLPG